uniref:Putative ovule protein n=1 Tax=Solanum chacoense TaxID=4108 RepID=A0A0V0GGV7_SOLCH
MVFILFWEHQIHPMSHFPRPQKNVVSGFGGLRGRTFGSGGGLSAGGIGGGGGGADFLEEAVMVHEHLHSSQVLTVPHFMRISIILQQMHS